VRKWNGFNKRGQAKLGWVVIKSTTPSPKTKRITPQYIEKEAIRPITSSDSNFENKKVLRNSRA